MGDIAIVAGVRTPFGRAVKGALKDTRPESYAAALITELLKRTPQVKGGDVEDVVFGCAMPEGEQGLNIARTIGVLSKLPVEVPAVPGNRVCASGLQAIAQAAGRLARGENDIAIAGGVESMSLVPMGGNKMSLHHELAESYPELYTPMGITAEKVAAKFGVSREEQDAFAVESHRKAAAAWEAGKFKDEVLPVEAVSFDGNGKRTTVTFAKDELVRPDSSIEKLAGLKPAFAAKGTVTAGNSSPLTDGAAAVLLMSREKAEKLGVKPLGWFRSFHAVGVAPEIMGIGPVPAIRHLMAKTGKSIGDIDLFEINEAFASQASYCAKELGVPAEKLNVNGGAIAIGHPLGATGARQVITILAELKRRGGKLGVTSMCVGGGMGCAGLVELA